MRQINVDTIRQAVKEMVMEANTRLPGDLQAALVSAKEKESSSRGARSWRSAWRMLPWQRQKAWHCVRTPAWW
jgi:tartrate dehydratase alpha subunit/fumarate hydratase class I-like protein